MDHFPGGGGTANASPSDGSGFSQLWCCVSIDEGGRWVAYESPDDQIAGDDTNGMHDIFIYQLQPYVYEVGSVQRVSINAQGEEGNGDSFNPDLSGDGNRVAYTSFASNLVDGDTNGISDVFISGIDVPPQRVSVASDGTQANGASYFVSVSYDGSKAAFVSEATNLVTGDTNGFADIFLRDISTGTTELISEGLAGAKANGASTMPSISADGHLVAFVSAASNLVAGDTNAADDIFIYDDAGTTTLLTKGVGGTAANGDSWAPVITPDGRYVVFSSSASNLVAGDTNGKSDVFIADRQTGSIQRVSVGLSGAEANGDSGGDPVTGPFPGNAWGVAVSSDGRYVSFISEASNLVAGDTNGKADVFLYDRLTGLMTLVDKDGSGNEGTGGPLGSLYAGAVAMSGDASVIAYISDATNLVPSDTDPSPDVFVYQANEPVTPALGTPNADALVGGDGRDAFAGFGGNDTLKGLAGDDLLYGEDGRDSLVGGEGSDVLDGGADIDRMLGGAGDDFYAVDNLQDVVIELSQSGQDRIETSLDGYVLPANVEELALLGTANLRATGNSGNNLMFGNVAANVILGGSGNDIISGAEGNDEIHGNDGDDRLLGEAGDDLLYGEAGDDTLDGGDNDDQLFGGTGIDALTGGAGSDTLDGGSEEDHLDGGAGVDRMEGGSGDDTYVVDQSADVVVEAGSGNGHDRVESTASFTLSAYVEDLALTGAAAVNATGNNIDNQLTGNSAANVLDGKAGNDAMTGGAGNDTYVVDSQSDSVSELAGGGTDTVQAGVSYSLATDVEALVLTGVLDLQGTGNTAANTLTGNAGDNLLDGLTGADTMTGGAGDDTYIVDNVGDVIVETAGQGTDLVRSSVTRTLEANVENLELTGSLSVSGTGNTLANTLLGNAGGNTLNGLDGDDTLNGGGANDTLNGGIGNDRLDGDTGADTMAGGAGNDTYLVDNVGDKANELVGEGQDLVVSTVTFTLGTEVEDLQLDGFSTVNGTGNALANHLTGNSSANLLDGLAGADILSGGQGDDTYVVDAAGDVVSESDSQGTDIVRASVSFTLDDNLENLTLLTGAVSGRGNALDNSITGNSAANTLVGGVGGDVLTGGLGADSFIYEFTEDSDPSLTSTDQITDFKFSEGDRIDLSLIDADLAVANDQSFTFIGTAAFSASAQVRATYSGGIATVELNTDADLGADMVISVSSTTAPVGGWFIL